MYTQDLSFAERAVRLGKRFGVDMRVRVGHLDVRTGVIYCHSHGRPEKPPFIEVGDRFGAQGAARSRDRSVREGEQRCWLCRCDCGSTVKQTKSQLVGGVARSCGCLQREIISRWPARTTSRTGTSVDARRRRRQSVASNADALLQPSLQGDKDYGGRGITVCRRWRQSFETFLADVGLRPGRLFSLGRKDNSKGYYPRNVGWETEKQQARNRRSNRHITAHGQTRTLTEWAERTGIGRTTLRRRIDSGWTPEQILIAHSGARSRR